VVVLRARFLRRLQIEGDDDHEQDQAIRFLPMVFLKTAKRQRFAY
jgi:hypothetical protein